MVEVLPVPENKLHFRLNEAEMLRRAHLAVHKKEDEVAD